MIVRIFLQCQGQIKGETAGSEAEKGRKLLTGNIPDSSIPFFRVGIHLVEAVIL